MAARKAFEDVRKWWIWIDTDKSWVVTPPMGYDPEEYEVRFSDWEDALDYWRYTHPVAEPMER